MEIDQTAKVCIFEMIYIYLLLVHIHNFAICPQAIVQQYFFFLQITRIFCFFFLFVKQTHKFLFRSIRWKNLPIIFMQNVFTLVRLFHFSQTKWTDIFSNMTLSMIFSASDCFCTNILNIFIFLLWKIYLYRFVSGEHLNDGGYFSRLLIITPKKLPTQKLTFEIKFS